VKSNYIVAFVLSFAVLLGWDYFVVRPRKRAALSAEAPVTAAATPGAPTIAATTAAPVPVQKESLVVHEIGGNRLSVNRWGGAVAQWEILENGRWLTLVPRADFPQQGLGTFPDLEFTGKADGDTLTLTAARPDGLRVEKTLRLSDNHAHALTIKTRNAGKADIDVELTVGWGPGVEGGDEAGAKGGASKGTQRAIVAEGEAVRRVKAGFRHRRFPLVGRGRALLPGRLRARTTRARPRCGCPRPTTISRSTQSRRRHPAPRRTKTATTLTFYLGPKILADLKATGLGLENPSTSAPSRPWRGSSTTPF
jgi:hypothetical protein